MAPDLSLRLFLRTTGTGQPSSGVILKLESSLPAGTLVFGAPSVYLLVPLAVLGKRC